MLALALGETPFFYSARHSLCSLLGVPDAGSCQLERRPSPFSLGSWAPGALARAECQIGWRPPGHLYALPHGRGRLLLFTVVRGRCCVAAAEAAGANAGRYIIHGCVLRTRTRARSLGWAGGRPLPCIRDAAQWLGMPVTYAARGVLGYHVSVCRQICAHLRPSAPATAGSVHGGAAFRFGYSPASDACRGGIGSGQIQIF